jgi:hypothetical protein
MVTLENLEQHTIPFDQFKLKWRFTEEKYNILPAHHLEQIRPLDKSASRLISDMTDKMFSLHHGLNRDYFKDVEGLQISEAVESEQLLKKWLYQRGLPFDQQVYVSWDSNTAAITSWKMIVKYWTDFDYGDDLVVVDRSLSWILVFFHYDYIQFGTNKERSEQICENELGRIETF